MSVDAADLRDRLNALPPDAKAEVLSRLARHRAARAGAHGPLGAGRRKWPTPGAMADALDPSTLHTPVLDLLDTELVKVADGVHDRLAFYMSPQEGKSQRVSRRFVTWLLAADPTLRIVIVSFEKGRAERWGRWARQDVETHAALGIHLREDSRAAGRWVTIEGGGVFTVGIGGALTGEPADVMVIDDPVKDRKQAESALQREAAWDWWESVGQARLSARGRVVLIMTRWHEDDLGGRLTRSEPARWRVVTVPAIAVSEDDPLGRKPGEEMVTVQQRPAGYFRDLQARMSPYAFQSVYQQGPTAATGNMFLRLRWRYWRPGAVPGQLLRGDRPSWHADLWRFATVDLAASTRTSADWTVVSAWGMAGDGDLILLDRARARLGEDAHADLVKPLVERWALDTVFIEKGFIGSTLVRDLTAAGIPTSGLDADSDKVTRAIPAGNRQQAGRIWLPSGAPWLDDWINEHAEFPNAAHDDQVDTTAYAVRVAGSQFNPASVPPATPPRNPDEGLDLQRVEW